MSCSNSVNEKNNQTFLDSLHDSQHVIEEKRDTLSDIIDTATEAESFNAEVVSINDWEIEDFIIKDKDKSSDAVRLTIENQKEEWKNVKNPIIASYKGCDFGDYFHLNFEDPSGKNYDFGFGENDYGIYTLFDEIDYADNPKYLGKSFKIYWDWRITSFPCCEGEYDLVEAYLPSIVKLELIATNVNKK